MKSRKRAMGRVPRGNRPGATGMRPQRAELANAEAYEAAKKAPKPKRAPKPDPHDHLWNRLLPRLREPAPKFVPGDALILNGPARSGWADSLPRRPWVVVECACGLCEAGTHVAIDVPHSSEYLELYPDAGMWQHVSAAALRRRGEFSRERAEAWADELAFDRVGNALAQTAEVNDPSARLLLHELTTLALADVFGGGALTDDQARQLEWWSQQRGGEKTPEQVAQIREWQRARAKASEP